VYRTLQVLKEQSLVAELHVPDGPTEYEVVVHGIHHHAVCTKCGSMLQFPPEVLASVGEWLLHEYDFRAELSHVAVPGVCSACAKTVPTGDAL
jgi:Fur family ferric uptake transcriptional regulator